MANLGSRRGEEGSVLVVALLVMALLYLLGATLLAVSVDETAIAANDQGSEGAFFAAEAAVQQSIDQITEAQLDPPPAVPVTDIGDRCTFRSGGRDDTDPQSPELIGTVNRPGFSVGATTGYNSSAYVFYIFQVNGTGTGPRNALREVEVQVEYGPVAR